MDGNFGAGKTRLTATTMLDEMFNAHRRMEEETRKAAEEKFKIIIHPGLITYDYNKSYTRKELDKKIKHNKVVKKHRILFGYKY